MIDRARGFSLTELLIVIAIVAIVAAIAFPSYQEQVIRSRRSDAYALLFDKAQRFERCMTEFNAYNHASCTADDDLPRKSENGHYLVNTTVLTAATYTLTATPQGPQTKDTDCGVLSLTHTGVKAAAGSGKRCW